MPRTKVIEVIADGKSIETAVDSAATKTQETLKNVKAINISNIQAVIEDGKISSYRVTAKPAFAVN